MFGPMEFEGIGLCFYERLGTRRPKAGEYFMSGAIPSGYRARSDLSASYPIVRASHYARTITQYVPAEPVRYTPGGLPLPRRRSGQGEG